MKLKRDQIQRRIAMFIGILLVVLFLIIFVNSQTYAVAGIHIDIANFPDGNFRTYVKTNSDKNNDDILDTSELNSTTRISVSGMNISDLKGIEYFTALTFLDCSTNQLRTLDITKNTALTSLNCGSNQIITLDVSKNTRLTGISCYKNKLTSLDISNNPLLTRVSIFSNQLVTLDISQQKDLTFLSCFGNQINELDIINNASLKELNCNGNQLKKLDTSHNPTLTIISCYNNQLTELDISKSTAITKLECYNNQLTTLDITKNVALKQLNCAENQLIELDTSNNIDLTEFACYKNQITELNVINNKNLTKLECYNNQLTQLDISDHSYLTRLTVFNNQLTQLDISKNTNLTYLSCFNNQLKEFDINENTVLKQLNCGVNQLKGLDTSQNLVLTDLTCNDNQITSLDMSENIELVNLNCRNNSLTELILNQNTKLSNINNIKNQSIDFKSQNQIYDLKNLNRNIDITKLSNIQGATLNGTVLENITGSIITYDYDLQNINTGTMDVTLNIIKEKNRLVQPLTIDNWTYGNIANMPSALSQFGTIQYVYSDFLDGEFTFDIPNHAGTWYMKVIVPEGHFYKAFESSPLEFQIHKARPEDIEEPAQLSAIYGNKLSDIKLLNGWEWEDGNIKPTVINNGYYAILKVDDSNNNYDYTLLDGYDANRHIIKRLLMVTVEKDSQPNISEPSKPSQQPETNIQDHVNTSDYASLVNYIIIILVCGYAFFVFTKVGKKNRE